ncbi:MAG TPA: hypothetical protein VFA12_20000 [Stellaceae bacterium]|nr:hypothetical protein [Stellaceae bacterium]
MERESETTSTTEIEVTPEMIEAGVRVLDEFFDYADDFIAKKVFCAMIAKSRREPKEAAPAQATGLPHAL